MAQKEHAKAPEHELPDQSGKHGHRWQTADAAGGQGAGSTGTGGTGSTFRSASAGNLARETSGVERNERLKSSADPRPSKGTREKAEVGELGRTMKEELEAQGIEPPEA